MIEKKGSRVVVAVEREHEGPRGTAAFSKNGSPGLARPAEEPPPLSMHIRPREQCILGYELRLAVESTGASH